MQDWCSNAMQGTEGVLDGRTSIGSSKKTKAILKFRIKGWSGSCVSLSNREFDQEIKKMMQQHGSEKEQR
ncbi:hypothetical protein Syun_023259 [Stephania yunnanensis]|uniref:Uncharacterized protein n=1 Tax=Stephania yunnanensis TaxID=152371 RepID=A0AAP0HZF4_9MAGN